MELKPVGQRPKCMFCQKELKPNYTQDLRPGIHNRGKTMIVWRKIISMRSYRVRCKPGYGSYMITLECGHTIGKKMSECKKKFVGSKMKCWQCEVKSQ